MAEEAGSAQRGRSPTFDSIAGLLFVLLILFIVIRYGTRGSRLGNMIVLSSSMNRGGGFVGGGGFSDGGGFSGGGGSSGGGGASGSW